MGWLPLNVAIELSLSNSLMLKLHLQKKYCFMLIIFKVIFFILPRQLHLVLADKNELQLLYIPSSHSTKWVYSPLLPAPKGLV
ncbi:hypothetical protein ASL11_35335 [Paenibacillus sp. Soil750]|nr:hypothetical protein ASL11_35335 [Paenibacillus sp. Soil750]